MSELNVGLDTIVDFVTRTSAPIERSPVAKISQSEYDLLRKEYSSSAQEKKEAKNAGIQQSE